MKVPLSWLKDFVDIVLSPEEIAYKLTFGGLEVEEIEYIGWPRPHDAARGLPAQWRQEFKTYGLSWDPAKIVVAQILEVMPHPNADRLTLLRLDDGSGKDQTVLTGAPNLFPYKGQGPLPKPLKVAYAREGSVLYDGHKPGRVSVTPVRETGQAERPRRAKLIACSSSGESEASLWPDFTPLMYERVSDRPWIEVSTRPSPPSSSIAAENERRPPMSPKAS